MRVLSKEEMLLPLLAPDQANGQVGIGIVPVVGRKKLAEINNWSNPQLAQHHLFERLLRIKILVNFELLFVELASCF